MNTSGASAFGGLARYQPRPWFAPLVVTVAVLADYFSPAALWTAALPLMFMAVLLCFRLRTAALVVLLTSSWILIPVVGAASGTLDLVRGTPHVYQVALDGEIAGPSCETRRGPVNHTVIFTDRDGAVSSMVGSIASSYAYFHNQIVTLDGDLHCRPAEVAQDLSLLLDRALIKE